MRKPRITDVTAPKVTPVTYRIVYQIQRVPGTAWETRTSDTTDRAYAEETLANLRALADAPDLQPKVRILRTNF